jgi:2-C-methyl-D-erythritol 4-phosphate cytidylyltransferase
MPARPVTDSIKAVEADGIVTATLDRSSLRTVQYPRGFAAEVLALLVNRNDTADFDELEATLSGGVPVAIVDGDDDAFHVELRDGTSYLGAFIESRQGPPGH